MEHHTAYKTYQYKLSPTPQQAQALETVVWRCRTLSTCALEHCALEQRTTWWERAPSGGPRGHGKGAA